MEIERESMWPPREIREKGLQEVRDTVKNYSDEMVDKWNQEIDGLLTFVSS